MKTLRIAALFLLLLSYARGANFHVAPDGSDSADGIDLPWASIGHAIAAAPIGSTVTIAPGTYNEAPDFNEQATAAEPILFLADGLVVVTGPVTVSGSYITVTGIKSGMAQLLDDSSNPSAFSVAGDHNILSGCVVDGIPNPGPYANEALAINVDGSDNVVSHCSVSNIDDTDAFHIFGDSNVIDACVVHGLGNTHYDDGAHADCVQSWGRMTHCVISNCLFYDVDKPRPHQFGILDTRPGGTPATVHDNTFRNNVIVGGEHFFLLMQNTQVLNNTWYRSAGDIGDLFFLDQATYSGYVFRNNIFYGCGAAATNGFIQGGIKGNTIVDHNFFAKVGNSAVAHAVGKNAINGGDPKFVDPANLDFRLRPTSVLAGTGIGALPVEGKVENLRGVQTGKRGHR